MDALLAQAGVLRASSIEELFDMAMAFERDGRVPRSRRTAVLTNAGGPGILAADAHGGDAASQSGRSFEPETVDALRPLFPAGSVDSQPARHDRVGDARGYRAGDEIAAGRPGSRLPWSPIFVPPFGVSQEDVAEAIVSAVAAESGQSRCSPCSMGREGLPHGRAELHARGVPAYVFPESAARALAALCRYQEWLGRPVTCGSRHCSTD